MNTTPAQNVSRPTATTAPNGIDPRGPRFGAAVTSVLLLLAVVLALLGSSPQAVVSQSVAQRASDWGFVVLAIVAVLFAWSLVSPRTQPIALLYRKLVQPRLAPPTELEDPRPPRFAQGVGLTVVGIGLVLHLVGVPWALVVAGAAAFVAAFLNAAFAFCLGCEIWLLLRRAGLVGRA